MQICDEKSHEYDFIKFILKKYSSRNVRRHFFDILYSLIPQKNYSGPVVYAIWAKHQKKMLTWVNRG